MQSPSLPLPHLTWSYRAALLVLSILTAILGLSIPAGVMSASTSAALLKDINPTGSSTPSNLVLIGNTLFFTADDGTTASTVLVKDINPGVEPAFEQLGGVAFLTNINGVLFFAADDGVHGRELWHSGWHGAPAGHCPQQHIVNTG